MARKWFHRLKRRKWLILFATLTVWFLASLPSPLFDSSYCTVIYSTERRLLGATISGDEQWRFPSRVDVPEKFSKALIAFEDRHFYDHCGIYLPSVIRAGSQNISSRERVSGASTITMQVIRMSRHNRPRNLWEKIIEMILALRLELTHSKEEILCYYASHAPFGSNVVGLDAAAWRYFGRTPEELSWAESATLAVLPNAPALIYPGRNQDRLRDKRNRLLQKLHEQGYFDAHDLMLAKSEPLPGAPHPLPQLAPHLLQTTIRRYGSGKRYESTIRSELQQQVSQALEKHVAQTRWDEIHNAAAVVFEVKSGNVIAYVGNTTDPENAHANQVDIVQAPRSTGSILKPFLYAAMLEDGLMLPNTLYPDIPMQYEGFAPKNFSEEYDGAVPASQALSRSLNVPSVVMLRDYSYPRFYHLLKRMGFRHLTRPADHYGLSMILGGAEASLWDIGRTYASMARTMDHWTSTNGMYSSTSWGLGQWLESEEQPMTYDEASPPFFSAGSIWATYNALLEVNRPDEETGWESFANSTRIAWKTGTSFGNRDAWAVGTTPEYVVAVWVGNHDGIGRPTLTGTRSAAPLMFDIFRLLGVTSWFNAPYDDMKTMIVCSESGMKAGPHCLKADSVMVPTAGDYTPVCSYHKLIHLSADGTYQVNMQCAGTHGIQSRNWFSLPAVQAHYYRKRHPTYAEPPPFAPGCNPEGHHPIGLIYPKSDQRILISRGFEGQYIPAVLEAAHDQPNAVLYWHLDDVYLGETRGSHKFSVQPGPGRHKLTLTDQSGVVLEKWIDVVRN